MKDNHIEKLIDILDSSKVAFGDDYLSKPKKEDIKVLKQNKTTNFKKRYLEKRKQQEKEKSSNKIEIPSNQNKKEIDNLSYNELEGLVLNCNKCYASSIRKSIIFGKGDINPKLMVIGEGPGREEDIHNEIFVGKSGQYLKNWLAAINLSFEKDVYLSNIVKCFSNSNPTKEIVNSCKPYLDRQIELVKPKAILILGKIAANNLLDKNSTMKDLRGNIYTYKKIPCIVTYHPAAVLRNPQWRAPVWQDLQKVEKLYSL